VRHGSRAIWTCPGSPTLARGQRLLEANAAFGFPTPALPRGLWLTASYRFTTVTVTADGYCREWCTVLRATTPVVSS